MIMMVESFFGEITGEKEVKKEKKDITNMLKVKSKLFDIDAGSNIIIVHEYDAKDFDIFAEDRVEIYNQKTGESFIAIANMSDTLIKRGEIGLYNEVSNEIKPKKGDSYYIRPAEKPITVKYIKEKMEKGVLKDEQIFSIIRDLMKNKLTKVELTAFIISAYINGLNMDETVALAKAIVESGDKLILDRHPVIDKHCIGGVAGNRTTMILVPVIAAAGLTIPKSSSRSITSPAGTADSMEVLAPVNLPLDEMKKIVLKTNGAIVWGGGLNLAAADDYLIHIRKPLKIDPRGMLLASIMAKKKAVGSEFVLIDIPVGAGAKVDTIEKAKELSNQFIELGGRLGMRIQTIITDGTAPIGRSIGPVLEAQDVLMLLENKSPSLDLRDKGCQMAGVLLESTGKAEPGMGAEMANNIIKNGKAIAKMREIIEAQGGDAKVKAEDLPVGQHRELIKSSVDSRIHGIENKSVTEIAMAAGAPKCKGAGIKLFVEVGDKIRVGDPLYEIYAESEAKLDQAIAVSEKINPVQYGKVILESYTGKRIFEISKLNLEE